jgi:hypothetical protein
VINQTFRLRLGSGPFVIMFCWLLPVILPAGTAVDVADPNNPAFGFIIFIMICAGISIYVLISRALTSTQCTQTEIRTRYLVMTRRCPWEQVSDITIVRAYAGRRTGRRPARAVQVTTTSGKRFRLAAPYDGDLVRDSEFDESALAIQNCWRKQRGLAAWSRPRSF